MSDAEQLVRVQIYKDMLTRALIFGGNVNITEDAANEIWNILDDFENKLKKINDD